MMRGCRIALASLLLAGCGDDTVNIDGGVGDVGVDTSDAGFELLPPDCEERFVVIASGLQPVLYSGRRTLIGATASIAPGELIGLWVNAAEIREAEIHRVSAPAENLLFLYATNCTSLRIEECSEFWIPTSGTLYVEQVNAEPGGVFHMIVGDVLMAPAELDLETFEVTLTTRDRCRYLERLDIGGRLVAASCDPPDDPICVLDTRL